jgi:uncharacterized protein YjbJ (UPF0337 family)
MPLAERLIVLCFTAELRAICRKTPTAGEIVSQLGLAQLKGMWKQRLGSAKTAWGRLRHDERLISQGRAQRLAGLLQARYAFSRVDADAQVQSFIAKHKD